jgi:TonB family protein
VAIHAAVLVGGLVWTLLRPSADLGRGDVPSLAMAPPRETSPHAEDDLPTEALPEVEPLELEPVLPAEESPPEPAAEELPPLEAPPPESAPPWELALDVADRRTRRAPPEAPREPPALARPASPPPAPSPRPEGTRTPLRPVRTPPPPFPSDLVPPGTRVVLWLTYEIAPDGTVREATVSRSSGHPAVDEAVRGFVLRNWRYAPPGVTRLVTRRFLFEPTG